ncbi:uncharacterized protein LOC134835532 [Culicoides brevitarsis]|uniref:uncharacterized protein LOC134835532 n=1 Tax=Culicoides brevitarsis TaxID=469753 RepID=UPI00307B3203
MTTNSPVIPCLLLTLSRSIAEKDPNTLHIFDCFEKLTLQCLTTPLVEPFLSEILVFGAKTVVNLDAEPIIRHKIFIFMKNFYENHMEMVLRLNLLEQTINNLAWMLSTVPKIEEIDFFDQPSTCDLPPFYCVREITRTILAKVPLDQWFALLDLMFCCNPGNIYAKIFYYFCFGLCDQVFPANEKWLNNPDLTDISKEVRNAAFFAFCNLAMLCRDKPWNALKVIPILLTKIEELIKSDQQKRAEISKVFNVLEAYITELHSYLPYLFILMPILIKAMHPENSLHLRAIAFKVAGTIFCKDLFQNDSIMTPWLPNLVDLLKTALTDFHISTPDAKILRKFASETLHLLIRIMSDDQKMKFLANSDMVGMAFKMMRCENEPQVKNSGFMLLERISKMLHLTNISQEFQLLFKQILIWMRNEVKNDKITENEREMALYLLFFLDNAVESNILDDQEFVQKISLLILKRFNMHCFNCVFPWFIKKVENVANSRTNEILTNFFKQLDQCEMQKFRNMSPKHYDAFFETFVSIFKKRKEVLFPVMEKITAFGLYVIEKQKYQTAGTRRIIGKFVGKVAKHHPRKFEGALKMN